MRVCVIGGGAAGLAAARHVLASSAHGVTVLERSDRIGGTWVYTEKVGLDDWGLPIHTSMYRSLRTNLPKEVMGFPDFPIEKHEKSYLPSDEILKFLNSYADHFDLRKHVQLYQMVTLVKPRGDIWEVTAMDVRSKAQRTMEFDCVLVCNGHYWDPFIPTVPGTDAFRGETVHSHDYRHPERFAGRRVLVLGAGPSGVDLCNELSATAEHVILSHHVQELNSDAFRENVTLRPDITTLTEKGAIFEDGTTDEFDILFYCTGYNYSFPFLHPDCGVVVDNNHVKPLYKHVIHIDRPTLGFIGIPYYVCAFSMFDLQARFYTKLVLEDGRLPSAEEMRADAEEESAWRSTEGLVGRRAHYMGPYQDRYYDDLAQSAGIEPLAPYMTKLHVYSSDRFLEDIVNFREDIFKVVDKDTFIRVK